MGIGTNSVGVGVPGRGVCVVGVSGRDGVGREPYRIDEIQSPSEELILSGSGVPDEIGGNTESML